MATPNSRATLIDYCKRRLGDPVIEINVARELGAAILNPLF